MVRQTQGPQQFPKLRSRGLSKLVRNIAVLSHPAGTLVLQISTQLVLIHRRRAREIGGENTIGIGIVSIVVRHSESKKLKQIYNDSLFGHQEKRCHLFEEILL